MIKKAILTDGFFYALQPGINPETILPNPDLSYLREQLFN
jgi:hypothetical protein